MRCSDPRRDGDDVIVVNSSKQSRSSLFRANATGRSPELQQQMERLHQLTVWGRWGVVGLLWLTLAPLSLWALRSDIALWLDYFTWAAVRYGLAFNTPAAVGISVCIGMTVSVLVWQSRNILWGLPAREVKRLERHVLQIRQQGPRHPFWRWVCGDRATHPN